jgi:hypothetical protein
MEQYSMQLMPLVWPSSVTNGDEVPTFQTLMVPSREQDAIVLSSGLNLAIIT